MLQHTERAYYFISQSYGTRSVPTTFSDNSIGALNVPKSPLGSFNFPILLSESQINTD